MTNLSTNPAEIISFILPWVLPENLENFAQCCKAVHRQANRKKGDNGHSLLQEHRILIQKFSVLTGLEDVGPYLRAMSANQRIARYVRKMSFGPSRKNVNVKRWGIEDLFEDKEVYELLFWAANTIHVDVLLADYLSKGRQYDSHQQMKRTIRSVCANTDIAIALLVPLLPNLSTLSFYWQGLGSHYHWNKHWISNLANSSVSILNKLKEVNVRSKDTSCILPEIVGLTALPSLQTLAVWHPGSPSFPRARHLWEQRQSYPRNTVRNLKLWNCTMETRMLHDYLESFDNLKSFCFLGNGPMSQSFTTPMPIFTILLSNSKSTLTKLSFRTYSGNATTKPPFKQLEVLKELYVDWQILLPQPYHAGEKWEGLLPQSLEALSIHDHCDVDRLKDWNPRSITKRFGPVVEDLISCKTEGLPGIRDFSFTATYGLHYRPEYLFEDFLVRIEGVELGFRNLCELVGLYFSFKKREVKESG